jgi:hypothetical protein
MILPRTRLFLVIAFTALLFLYSASTAPSPAKADYAITLCGSPPLTNGASGHEAYSEVGYRCTSSPPAITLAGNYVSTTEGLLGTLTFGRTYAVGVSVPGRLTISSVNVVLTSEARRSGSAVELLAEDPDGVFFGHMIGPQEGLSYTVNQVLPAGDKSVSLGERCVPVVNASCYFQSQHGILTIEGLQLVLHDDESPSLSLTGGRLLLPGAQAGTEDVTFSASAQESGIAEVDAYLGSTLVGSDAYQSTQCSYTQFDPCPKNVSDDLTIDTTKVPDGTYPLVLEASDASGNTVSVASSDPITVANHASPAGGPQGNSAQASSAGPGAPNGHSATTKAQITYLGSQQGKLEVWLGQSASVSGRLTNQTGVLIPGAKLDILSQTVGSNLPFAVIGHASTDADGMFTFRVPAGPSRVIRTGYRAFANDSGYDATADLTENVTATTTLSVTPKHLRGRTFTFRGQVHAGDFPPGQQVDIKVLIGNSWSHVTFAPVAADGRFKIRYRLKHYYSNVTFTFRATPIANPIWPYQPQQSNPASLHLL